jgi:hypothetical protein
MFSCLQASKLNLIDCVVFIGPQNIQATPYGIQEIILMHIQKCAQRPLEAKI